jgi:hypothetical protein
MCRNYLSFHQPKTYKHHNKSRGEHYRSEAYKSPEASGLMRARFYEIAVTDIVLFCSPEEFGDVVSQIEQPVESPLMGKVKYNAPQEISEPDLGKSVANAQHYTPLRMDGACHTREECRSAQNRSRNDDSGFFAAFIQAGNLFAHDGISSLSATQPSALFPVNSADGLFARFYIASSQRLI